MEASLSSSLTSLAFSRPAPPVDFRLGEEEREEEEEEEEEEGERCLDRGEEERSEWLWERGLPERFLGP